MKTRIAWIMTRTPLHVGAGSSVGAIDMPVARERHTQTPIVPGSGLKGVLRDQWTAGETEQTALFGPDSASDTHVAGELVVGEARVVCFPVRSAKNSFAWLTCPLVLQRVARERGLPMSLPVLEDNRVLAAENLLTRNKVVLEEYSFSPAGPVPPEAIAALADAFDDELWKTLPSRLAIVSDGMFSHFCANACEVQQRIKINDDTGTVAKGGLFNQENVPSETAFYAVMNERKAGALDKLSQKLTANGNIIQIGGDETVGLGYCSINLQGGE